MHWLDLEKQITLPSISWQPWWIKSGTTQGNKKYTPLKVNMEPKNGGLKDDFPFQLGDFGVLC